MDTYLDKVSKQIKMITKKINNMNKQALDRFLTTEPDNGYTAFIEKIWQAIPEEEISGDDYDKHDTFFSYWENKLSTSGITTRENPTGFPILNFCVNAIKRRYRMLKYILAENWIMEEPDLFISPVDGRKLTIENAFSVAWNYKNPPPIKKCI